MLIGSLTWSLISYFPVWALYGIWSCFLHYGVMIFHPILFTAVNIYWNRISEPCHVLPKGFCQSFFSQTSSHNQNDLLCFQLIFAKESSAIFPSSTNLINKCNDGGKGSFITIGRFWFLWCLGSPWLSIIDWLNLLGIDKAFTGAQKSFNQCVIDSTPWTVGFKAIFSISSDFDKKSITRWVRNPNLFHPRRPPVAFPVHFTPSINSR